jgi:uncharacterized membrane protein YfhO
MKNSNCGRYGWYLTSFIVPVAILCLIAVVDDIYPFGSQSFLTADLRYQYIDFYTWYRNVLLGDGSFFYSFSQSLGTNTWGQFSYYLGSPLNLIILLFPADKLTVFVFAITALKMGLINLATTWYFTKRFKGSAGIYAALALCLTFSLWMFTQARNPIWLDAFVCLPLMLWGVYSYIHGRRWKLLLFSTALSVVSCWYMAYMSVVFAILFYFFERYLAGKRIINLKNLVGLGLVFFGALGLSAFTFFSTVLSFAGDTSTIPLGSTTANISSFADSYGSKRVILVAGVFLLYVVALAIYSRFRKLREWFVLVNAVVLVCGALLVFWCAGKVSGNNMWTCSIENMLAGFVPTLWRADVVPQLYCGFLIPLLCLATFFVRSISLREKSAFLVFLALMFFVFFVKDCYVAWCGFRAPHGFYCRSSIYFDFVMVWVVAFGISRLCAEGKLFPSVSGNLRKGIVCLIFILACVELSLSGGLLWARMYGPDQVFQDEYMETSAQLQQSLDSLEEEPYRSPKTITRFNLAALNEGLAQGYLDISSYSSAHNGNAIRFLNGLGYSQEGEFATRYSTPSLLIDSLLGIKFVCTNVQPAGFTQLDIATGFEGYNEYENPYALGLGYQVSSDVLDASVDYGGNPFGRQNTFVNSLMGESLNPYSDLVSSQIDTGVWQVTIPKGVVGYYYVNAKNSRDVYVSVNGSERTLQNNRFQQAATALNSSYDSDQEVKVAVANEAGNPVDCELIFYGLNMDSFETAINKLSQHQVIFQTFEDGYVEASFVSETSGQSSNIVLFTFPYDAGWAVEVDGQPAELLSLFGGALSGLSIPADGETHEITMSYISPGFVTGCAVTGFAIICIAGIIAFGRKRKGKHVKVARVEGWFG